MANIAHKSRVFLINIGKILPFLVCFVVAISDIECGYSLCTENYVIVGNIAYLYKPISWQLGKVFEYNIQLVFLLTVLSFAIKTCKWNKLAILYLFVQIGEKQYFSTHQWDSENGYYLIIALNVIVCLFLNFKGIKNYL